MVKPSLFIVAGPNGSGKSLFSKELTESDFEVFDGDKHMTELVKQFPETGSEALWSFINDDIFAHQKMLAISQKSNYAYETNFSGHDPMSSAKQFREAGFDVHLIFMGLETLEESIQRVAYRVKLGGHKVTEQSIRFNFENGYKNLYCHLRDFTTVTIFSNAISHTDEATVPTELLHISENKLHIRATALPDWVKPILAVFETDSI